MKLIRQFGIILAITFAGEVLKGLLPLPIPVSIYGLLLMLVLLITGILPLEAVQDAGKFLIEIMPVLFVPAAVGLLDSWPSLQAVLLPIAVITVVTTIFVMAVSGLATQAVIRRERKKK